MKLLNFCTLASLGYIDRSGQTESTFLIQGFDEMELLFELMDVDGRLGCS